METRGNWPKAPVSLYSRIYTYNAINKRIARARRSENICLKEEGQGVCMRRKKKERTREEGDVSMGF